MSLTETQKGYTPQVGDTYSDGVYPNKEIYVEENVAQTPSSPNNEAWIEVNDGYGGFKTAEVKAYLKSDEAQKGEVREAPRLNEGKVKMKYWLMFPHAAKAICESLEKNEAKYPNDGFAHYVPQETASSLLRHMFDAMSPEQVHNFEEEQRDHLVAVAFNALCLLENCIAQGYEFPTTGRCL